MTVLVGDNPLCTKDINRSLVLGIPLIVLEGSNLVQSLTDPNLSNYFNYLEKQIGKKEYDIHK